MGSIRIHAWLLGAALAAAALGPSAARAQGLAGGLDDPTGRAAPRARPAVVAAPDDDAVPPAPGSPAAVPLPPGASVPAPPGSAAGDPSSAAILTRLRAIDASLTALSASSGPDYLRAILSMLAGGAGIAFGAIALELGPPYDSMAPYFMVLGGTTIVRSVIVEFILPPDTRTPAIEFQSMPSGTHAQRLARLEYGEEQLEAIAEASMISRIVDGSINMAGALAIIPAYLAPRGFELSDPIEAVIFIGPAIALVGGIITLASPSGAEQRWSAYQELRERLGDRAALDRVRERAVAPRVDFGVAAGPDGGLATMSGRF